MYKIINTEERTPREEILDELKLLGINKPILKVFTAGRRSWYASLRVTARHDRHIFTQPMWESDITHGKLIQLFLKDYEHAPQ